MSGQDTRRSARVETKLLVAVDGLDVAFVRRKGDISATGIYFETDKDLGDVGTVHFLRVASADRKCQVHVMAHVVRTVTLNDASGGKVGGAALEFMPESEEQATALQNFVHYTLTQIDRDSEPKVSDARLSAFPPASTRDEAVVRELSVRAMILETSWPVSQGDVVRAEIAAPGTKRRIALQGKAKRVMPSESGRAGPPYRVEVVFDAEIQKSGRISSMMMSAVKDPTLPLPAPTPRESDTEVESTLDTLFSAIIRPPPESVRPKRHLSGEIARVRLPTLCSLFEMEQMSGELVLRRPEENAILYLSRGRIVDVSPLPPKVSVREKVKSLLSWENGTFEFDVKSIDRLDRLGLGTTALLLDLARETDEERASQ